MSYAALKEESVHLFNEYPFLTSIRDEQDYNQAIELKDSDKFYIG